MMRDSSAVKNRISEYAFFPPPRARNSLMRVARGDLKKKEISGAKFERLGGGAPDPRKNADGRPPDNNGKRPGETARNKTSAPTSNIYKFDASRARR